MKVFKLYIILLFTVSPGAAQVFKKDSLLGRLSHEKQDTARVDLLNELGFAYQNTNTDSMFWYANEGLKLAYKMGYTKGVIEGKSTLAAYWWQRGDYATAVNLYLQILQYFKAQKDTFRETLTYSALLNCYRDQGDHKEALHYGRKLLTNSN
jgi:tetratricopeptide (TPR) repeat protein